MESISSHLILNLSKDSGYKDDLGIHIALFKNVKNVSELLDKSIQENASFIDASLIISLNQLLIALNRSLYIRKIGKNRLNNFYAEILFNLSITNNISDSLKQFGIEKLLNNEYNINLIVITIDKLSIVPELFNKIDGELIQLTNDCLNNISNLNLIKKIYKTDNISIIESKIASKEFLN